MLPFFTFTSHVEPWKRNKRADINETEVYPSAILGWRISPLGCWEALLKIPTIKDTKLVGTRSRAFLVVAQLLWNSLLPEAHLLPSPLRSRKLVKVELFRWANIMWFCFTMFYLDLLFYMNCRTWKWFCNWCCLYVTCLGVLSKDERWDRNHMNK